MKAIIKIEKEVDLRTMHVSAGVRYWEDGEINGQADEDGSLIPCRRGDLWEPIIDLESGIIKNWEKGKRASIHYKVCDQCSYYYEDSNGDRFLAREQEYVPNILCPGGSGYGDYIIMEIDENGVIADWKAHLGDILDDPE
jgi:hypothetical protein